ncbi:MAG: RIP metalloprotease RseP [Bacteroidetes bacterium]|nr:MAG: RIP metalloprotease RseP [Bacteroidota bacterium]
MNYLVMAGQMILALSILISLHELGHFLAARAFGIKVEKFYLFFDAWGVKLFSFKKGDTEYGIGWLPLGGYVKISGMIDESMDTEQMKSEPQPYEFRSKPAWQRLIVMLAGVTVNIILGVLIFGFSLSYYGDSYLPNTAVVHGIYASDYAKTLGFQDGDKIVAINGETLAKFDEVYNPKYILDKGTRYTIDRNGSTVEITLPDTAIATIAELKMKSLIGFRQGFKVGEISKGSNAQAAGLMEGDSILSVNDTQVLYFNDFQEALARNKGAQIALTVFRDNKEVDLQAEVTKGGTLGFAVNPEKLAFETEHYGFGKSMAIGTSRAFESLVMNIKGFGKVFSGEVDPSKSLMGPIRLATIFGSDWIWQKFWGLTALLSMVLAFMNVLPIPALDGGHALFLSIEMVIGRPLGDKFLQVTQVIGMVILLSLMIFVFGNDIWNLAK